MFRYTKRQSVSSICLSVVSSKSSKSSSSKSRREIISKIKKEDSTSKTRFETLFLPPLDTPSRSFLDPIPSKRRRRRLKAVVSIVRKNKASHPVVASFSFFFFFVVVFAKKSRLVFRLSCWFRDRFGRVDWSSSSFFESAVIQCLSTFWRSGRRRELESLIIAFSERETIVVKTKTTVLVETTTTTTEGTEGFDGRRRPEAF